MSLQATVGGGVAYSAGPVAGLLRAQGDLPMHVSTKTTLNRLRLRTVLRSCLFLAALTAVAGCRGGDSLPSLQVYQVKGKVVLADGRPLTSGWVYFVPTAGLPVTPSAQLAPDGTFSLVTGGSGEGAPAGDYKVRIEAPEFGGAPRSRKGLFPFKYTDEDSSKLVVTVRPQPNQLEPFRLR
jgi:hypothetical protein